MDNHLMTDPGIRIYFCRRLISAVFFLLVCLTILVASSTATAAAPPAGTPASRNLSNSAADGQPAPIPSAAAETFARPLPASTMPISSGFDFPVGGALHHEGFEMNNCFSCDWLGCRGRT